MLNRQIKSLLKNINYYIKILKRKKAFWLILLGYLLFLYKLLLSSETRVGHLSNTKVLISGLFLSLILLILSSIDLVEMFIPNSICISGVFLGLMFTAVNVNILEWPNGSILFIEHLFAAKSSQLIMKNLSYLSKKMLGQEALGIGDANMVAIGGAWLGISGVALASGLAFVSAGIFSFVGIVFRILKPLEAFPFGPFISAGILGVWLFEPNWWSERWLGLWGL